MIAGDSAGRIHSSLERAGINGRKGYIFKPQPQLLGLGLARLAQIGIAPAPLDDALLVPGSLAMPYQVQFNNMPPSAANNNGLLYG